MIRLWNVDAQKLHLWYDVVIVLETEIDCSGATEKAMECRCWLTLCQSGSAAEGAAKRELPLLISIPCERSCCILYLSQC